MNPLESVQIALYLILLVAATPLLGRYMARVFQGAVSYTHLTLPTSDLV